MSGQKVQDISLPEIPQAVPSDDAKAELSKELGLDKPTVLSWGEYLTVQHQKTTPLIGIENDALLNRGEGLMIGGTGGVGKTTFITGTAASLAIAENILKYVVQQSLRVLIYQAELPAPFFQGKLKPIHESYKLSNEVKAQMICDNIFISQEHKPFDIAAKGDSAFNAVERDVERYEIDVVIVDPFLSYFNGNENDNNEVRRALDRFKYHVAEKYQCGLIITDHQPKYSNSNKNPEQQHSMRGAGAKRDWAASVIALNKTKTPTGQHGTFLKATVDKMRYGKEPREPFTIRRDDYSFRHILFRDNDVAPYEVAQVLDEAGGGLSTRSFQKALKDSFSISDHDARSMIKSAVSDGWIITENGKRKAVIHNLGDKYVEWRKK